MLEVWILRSGVKVFSVRDQHDIKAPLGSEGLELSWV